jgi:hypothetical protein
MFPHFQILIQQIRLQAKLPGLGATLFGLAVFEKIRLSE